MHEVAISLALQIRYSKGLAALLRGCDATTPLRITDDLTPLLYATTGDILSRRYRYLATRKHKKHRKRSPVLNGSYDNTALHVATHNAQLNMVSVVVADNLIDVNSRNWFGNAPLHVAVVAPRWNRARRQSLAIIDVLLASDRVDMNVRNRQGVTPMLIAASKGRVTVVTRLLSDPRVDVLATDAEGRSVLHLAAENGHVEVLSMFLDDDRFRSQVNARTNGGRTPLHHAASHGRIGTMGVLLRDERVGLHATDSDGTTFMDLFLGYNEASLKIRRRIKTDNQSFDEDYVPSVDRCERIHLLLQELTSLFAIFRGTSDFFGKSPKVVVGDDVRDRIVDLYAKHWVPVKCVAEHDPRTELIAKYC